MQKIQRYFIFPSIALIIYFLYRLMDYSQIMFYHPLSNIKHDVYGYIVQIFTLDACGIYNLCPYWYNGFMTFIGSPPGWYLFSYPLYLITNSTQVTFYLSMVITLILSFIVILLLGKKIMKFNLINCLFIFAFFFGSNTLIHTIRIGRPHEIFAWLHLIIALFIVWHYKNNPFDKRFYLIIPVYSITLLSYHSVGIILATPLLGLFLIKQKKEKIILIKTLFIVFLITLLWIIPLLLNSSYTSLFDPNVRVETLWSMSSNGFFHFTPIAIISYSLGFFFLLYLYLKQQDNMKKELLFFLPTIILVILFLTGVVAFFPLLSSIFTNIYLLFILLIMLIILANLKSLNKKFDLFIITLVFSAALLFILVSQINNPLFDRPTQEQLDMASLFTDVHGKYEIFSHPPQSSKAYYSYGVIYYNLTTVRGNYPSMTSFSYIKKVDLLNEKFLDKDCNQFLNLSKELNVEYYLAYDKECEIFTQCGLKLIKQKNKACLYV